AHPLTPLLLAVGPASSASDPLDHLFALSGKGVGEQTLHTMLGEHGLRRAHQGRLLGDLAFATSHGRGQGQQGLLGFGEAFLEVTAWLVRISRGGHYHYPFLPAERSADTRAT